MAIFDRITSFAADWREQRRHLRTVSMFSALPAELQRDIGWPAAAYLHLATRVRRHLR